MTPEGEAGGQGWGVWSPDPQECAVTPLEGEGWCLGGSSSHSILPGLPKAGKGGAQERGLVTTNVGWLLTNVGWLLTK
jgi:hypothetical protein